MSKLKIQLKKLLENTANNDRESMKGKLIYGIFWNFISALASQGIPMIAAIITARILGNFCYGQLGMINSTIILFSTFAGLGLGITATKYIAQLYQTDKERTGRIMGLTNLFGAVSGIIMCIILFIIAPWLASNTLAAPDLVTALRIASLLLIFNTILGIQAGSVAGFGAFRDLARVSIFQGIISASISVTGVYFFGLIGAVTAMVINSIINLILYKITINNLIKGFKIKIDYLRSWREKDIIWKLSFPSMLSSLMVGPVVWVANIIIINTVGGYGQLGIFNAADQWRNMLLVLPYIIGGVLLPMISSNVKKENKALETVNVLSSWIIVIIIALPLISFPEIIALFYGESYFSTVFLQSLASMMFVSCLLAYTQGISRKLVAKNLMWWGVLNNIIWASIFLILVSFLKTYGALGLSISYLISYIIVTITFIPVYLHQKVVPKALLISKEVILVWIILIIQTINTILGTPILIRLLMLIVSIIILIFSFHSIWGKNNDRSD